MFETWERGQFGPFINKFCRKKRKMVECRERGDGCI